MARVFVGRMKSRAAIGGKTHAAILILFFASLVSAAIQVVATLMHVPIVWPVAVIAAAAVVMSAISLRHWWLSRKEVYRFGLYWTVERSKGDAGMKDTWES